MEEAKTKNTWSKEAGYIWSMIGSAVGFANILSFSALCYKNGGGAFLIPYLFAHILVGVPMLILEGTIGQKTKLPIVSAMGAAAGGKGKLLGWLSVMTCATIGGFYVVLTGFSVAYAYFSARGSIPADTAGFFKNIFLKDSGSLGVLGGIAPAVLISTLIIIALTWAVMTRRIQSGIEKLCSLFLPLLGVLVILFTAMTLFLPGATEGYKHYLIPDFSRLGDWTLWRDVFGQVFFSLSLGLGIVTGYSRHNPSSFNIPRAMVKVAIGDFIISFVSGFAIFGCIGFMSAKSGIPFSSLVSSDSAFEIGFVIFPMILAQFGAFFSKILGPVFFFCVFIAGITGVFSIVESIAGNIEVEFGKTRKKAVAFSMGIIALLTLPFCAGNGQHLLGAIAPMVLGDAMLIGGIVEILFFLILSKSLIRDERKNYAYFALIFVVLPLLVMSLGGALFSEFRKPFHLSEGVRWGWLVCVLAGSFLLARKKFPVAQTISLPAEVELSK